MQWLIVHIKNKIVKIKSLFRIQVDFKDKEDGSVFQQINIKLLVLVDLLSIEH